MEFLILLYNDYNNIEREDSIMAYETKVLLSLLADTALRTGSKEMYKVIAKIANTEGMVLKPYDEALEELEADRD